MTNDRVQKYFFLALLLVNFVLVVMIFRPYIGLLVLAVTFAVIFYPLYQRLLKAFLGQETVAALFTTLIILLLFFGPLFTLGYLVFQEALRLYTNVSNESGPISETIIAATERNLHELFPQVTVDLSGYARRLLDWVIQRSGSVFASITQMTLSLFLSLIAIYYLLKDGARLRKAVIRVSPMLDKYDKEIFAKLHVAITSVIKGSLTIAFLQGFLTGVGLTIFGVPNAILWGCVTVIASLVPTVGTAIVLVPMILFLFLTGHPFAAVGLLIWGATAVGLLDNLLGPKLIERGLRIHPFLILLAVLGGITLFGPFGFLIGPLFLSLLFALLEIYPLVFKTGHRKVITT